MDASEDSIEADIESLVAELPSALRAFIARGDALKVTKEIMSQYSLHIDQAGILEHELLLLIVGIHDLEQFTNALKVEANLTSEIIEDIVKNANEKIFIPLRKEEETGDTKTSTEARKTSSVPLAPTSAAKIPQIHYAPITDPERELPVGEGPSINSLKNAIPSNLPGTMPPQQTPQMPIMPSNAAPAVPPIPGSVPPQNGPKPKIKVPAPDITSYSIDPYREPLDEDKAS